MNQRHTNRIRWIVLLLIGQVTLSLAGCASSPAPTPPLFTPTSAVESAIPTQMPTIATATGVSLTPTPALPSALRIAGNDPLTLDPALAGDVDSSGYLVEIFGGLVTLDRNLNVMPDIAESWDVNDGGTVFTFHIRKDAKFQDGRMVTAQDFKYSIERAADPRTKSLTASTYLGDIVGVKDKLNGKTSSVKGVQVIDNNTLRITIDAPKSYFLSKLSYPTAFVVDKNNIERNGASWTHTPNGTGPYKLKEYIPKQRLILAKNDNYYLDPKPQIAQVNFILIPNGPPLTTMYTNGELDVLPIYSDIADRVRDPSYPFNKELVTASELSTNFIAFNDRKPPFDDPKVRQAFALAIDRQKVIDEEWRKVPLLAKSILPPGIPGYNDALPDIGYNPDRAKQLLAESKYAGHLPSITWGTPSTITMTKPIADMIKANLGVAVAIKQTDWGTFLSAISRNNNPYQIFDYGWIADYADPEDFIAPLFRTNSPNNYSGYSNPVVDKLIDQGAVEQDASQRLKLYQQAEQMILQDMPAVPFYYGRSLFLVKPYVKGVERPPLILPWLVDVSVAGQ